MKAIDDESGKVLEKEVELRGCRVRNIHEGQQVCLKRQEELYF